MVIGHQEKIEDRVGHLNKIRQLQDKTRLFRSFIPWIYHPGNNKLGGAKTTVVDYLKTLALSRIFLDNFENIQGSWLTIGKEGGQLSLFFGANDLGSIMLEENVVRSTGYQTSSMTVEEIVKLIAAAGFVPAQRNSRFEIIKIYPFEKKLLNLKRERMMNRAHQLESFSSLKKEAIT